MAIKGKQIILKPEWLEEGEQNINCYAISEIEKGRLDIEWDIEGFTIKPTNTIKTDWIEEVK